VGERLTFQASVAVRAEPARVFALVSDLRRKARLNPNIEVIRVELEGEEPVGEGSVFYHRFQRERRIVEYRSRCVRFDPPRLIVGRGETDPPFEVRVTVDPIPGGCRLTQEETLEAGADLLDALDPAREPAHGWRDVVRLLAFFPGGRRLGSELRAHQRDRVARRLAGELEAWLQAIRSHVEGDAPGPRAAARRAFEHHLARDRTAGAQGERA
jgi:hypothetical protein